MPLRSPGVAAAAILLGLSGLASAQSVPPAVGSDLLRSCNALLTYAKQGGEISVDMTSCAAYLRGLRDAVEASNVRPPDRAFCAEGVALDELARVIVKHVQERPDSNRKPAAGEAILALNRAYPCAKTRER